MIHRSTLTAFFGLALLAGLPTGASAFDLSGSSREAAPQGAPVRMAQVSGSTLPQITQLQEEIRRLNGRVEELSFQLLQAQEQMRKQMEDFEFRFQELEGGSGNSGSGSGRRTEAAPRPAEGQPSREASRGGAASPQGSDQIGEILGSGLDFNGVGSTSSQGRPASQSGSDTVASVEPEGQGGMYDLAYNYLLAGDYQLAEQAFRQYSQTYPNASDAPDAEYWLGESLFQQQKYADAAEVFLNAQKDHPKTGKAPEMMLKLGMSLAKLDNRDTACVTYKEVARRYPQMSGNVKTKLQAEQKAASC